MYDSHNDGDKPSSHIAVTPLSDAIKHLSSNMFIDTSGKVQDDCVKNSRDEFTLVRSWQ